MQRGQTADGSVVFALGASGGLMTMVREQEAVFFVIPLVELLTVVVCDTALCINHLRY